MGCCETKERVPTQCCICYDMKEGEPVGAKVLPCGHNEFHESCILAALRIDSRCPLCRAQVVSCNGRRVLPKKQAVNARYAEDMPLEGIPDVKHEEEKLTPVAKPSPPRARVPSSPSLYDLPMEKEARKTLLDFARNFTGIMHRDARRPHSLLVFGPADALDYTLKLAFGETMPHYGIVPIGTKPLLELRTHPFYRQTMWIDVLHARLQEEKKLGPRLRDLLPKLHEDDNVLIATTSKPWLLSDDVLQCFEAMVYLPSAKMSAKKKKQFSEFVDQLDA